MVETIDFVKDWRCFKAGDGFTFDNPGVNLLVGDQGCGKSSLLTMIQACGHSGKRHKSIIDVEKLKKHAKLAVSGPCQSLAFDFEKDNFRTKAYFDYDKSIQFHVASMWKSHGESSRVLIQSLNNQPSGPCVVFVDEPDTALSIKSIFILERVLKGIAERGGQVIAAVHNPFLILAFDKVLSLEHRRWMSGREFVDLSISEYKEEKKSEKKENAEKQNESEVPNDDSSGEQISGC